MNCCLCGRHIVGRSYDAQPLKEGQCCIDCSHKANVAKIRQWARVKVYAPRELKKLEEQKGITINGERRI